MTGDAAFPVIILGAGGHAKVVADALLGCGQEVLGFATPEREAGSKYCGLHILGDDAEIGRFSPDQVLLANGIGALPRRNLRAQLAKRWRSLRYRFITVIHPSAMVAKDVELGEGVQVMAGAVIQPGSVVGEDVIINSRALVEHDCRIAQQCHLGPGSICCGGVTIGAGCYIGAGSVVIQNVTIGEESLVAAGSTVFEDVDSHVTFIHKQPPTLINEES